MAGPEQRRLDVVVRVPGLELGAFRVEGARQLSQTVSNRCKSTPIERSPHDRCDLTRLKICHS
jgi:hypothetical protein